jgi:hypothetical protein
MYIHVRRRRHIVAQRWGKRDSTSRQAILADSVRGSLSELEIADTLRTCKIDFNPIALDFEQFR